MADNLQQNNNQQNIDQSQAQMQDQNVLTDKQSIPVQDGQIPQDDGSGNNGLQVNAIGLENIDVKFEKGNLDQVEALPQLAQQKIDAVAKTLIPLIEVALIELTGTSQSYKRVLCQLVPSINADSTFALSFSIQYSVPGYIGTDFEYADLQADSKYIYDRITPAGIKISKCEIDTADGSITIMGEL